MIYYQNTFFTWNLANNKYFFRRKFRIFWMKGKADPETSNNPKQEEPWKKLF